MHNLVVSRSMNTDAGMYDSKGCKMKIHKPNRLNEGNEPHEINT